MSKKYEIVVEQHLPGEPKRWNEDFEYEPDKYPWHRRYVVDDDGIRFTQLEYIGTETRGGIYDGILGDKQMRKLAKTKILERRMMDDILKDEWSIDEINDYIRYMGWNIWDVLCLRATEGHNPLIPRQEYEMTSFLNEYFRYPEIMEYITKKVGKEGVVEIGRVHRKEIGTKINNVHNWCLAACPLMGRVCSDAMGYTKPWEFVNRLQTILQFNNRVWAGSRDTGYFATSQQRGRSDDLECHWIEQFKDEVEPLNDGTKKALFRGLNAATELLAFFLHYDCRLGLGDSGPYELGDGKIMIVREHYLNEPVYHWNDVCVDQQLPHAVIMPFIIDAEAMNLQEIRVNDISTTFTSPENYPNFITHAACYIRQEWNTPMSQIERLEIDNAGDLIERAGKAVSNLYRKFSRMTRRERVFDGAYDYYVEMILPHIRAAGLYKDICNNFDFWEFHPKVAEAYYDMCRFSGAFSNIVVPRMVFGGVGYNMIPHDADRNAVSKWFKDWGGDEWWKPYAGYYDQATSNELGY